MERIYLDDCARPGGRERPHPVGPDRPGRGLCLRGAVLRRDLELRDGGAAGGRGDNGARRRGYVRRDERRNGIMGVMADRALKFVIAASIALVLMSLQTWQRSDWYGSIHGTDVDGLTGIGDGVLVLLG